MFLVATTALFMYDSYKPKPFPSSALKTALRLRCDALTLFMNLKIAASNMIYNEHNTRGIEPLKTRHVIAARPTTSRV
jgi:hypothetical protein